MKPFTAKKRTYTITAIQWNAQNMKDVKQFLGESKYIIGNDCDGFVVGKNVQPDDPVITLTANDGDYVVQLNKYEFYVYKPEKFRTLFEFCPTVEDIQLRQYANLRKHFQKMKMEVLGGRWYSCASDLYQGDADVCEAITYRATRTLWQHFCDIVRGL